jgi:hypothetical protein
MNFGERIGSLTFVWILAVKEATRDLDQQTPPSSVLTLYICLLDIGIGHIFLAPTSLCMLSLLLNSINSTWKPPLNTPTCSCFLSCSAHCIWSPSLQCHGASKQYCSWGFLWRFISRRDQAIRSKPSWSGSPICKPREYSWKN